jgi:hypothetical protein
MNWSIEDGDEGEMEEAMLGAQGGGREIVAGANPNVQNMPGSVWGRKFGGLVMNEDFAGGFRLPQNTIEIGEPLEKCTVSPLIALGHRM